ncbi:MAG: exonuclease SbcCD subunit D [Butyrivibrio sp.]|jgi:exonuclease SbcD|nr:exonuclease SbcCD subunit D [Butyrivibrio sp.]
MRLMHLSDLHLGKRVYEFSMYEDQKYILKQILKIAGEQKADAVLISGDVYDKPIPPAEAVQLFDDFLTALSDRKVPVYVISGNHDSAERLSFGARLMTQSSVFMSVAFHGTVQKYSQQDEYGTVNFYLLPFLKPTIVRQAYPEAEIGSYQEAVQYVLAQTPVDKSQRSVLLAHQFVTGAKTSESEEILVGGLDNMDASLFDDFDYVALGHIHTPQKIGRETVRYCGTPLKYSFSEAKRDKSVTMVELREKGSVQLQEIPLHPLHDLRELKGSYEDLTARKNYAGTKTDDYLHITLTDEEDIPDVMDRLHTIYPGIMKLDYDNLRTRTMNRIDAAEQVQDKTPAELFAEFYELQNNQPMSAQQQEHVQKLIDEIWGQGE